MTKKIIVFFLISLCLFGCGKEETNKGKEKKEEKKVIWKETDFENLGITDFEQIDNFNLNVYNTTDNMVSINLSCKESACEFKEVNNYLEELFNKVVTISESNVYKLKPNLDFTYNIDEKISKYNETKAIENEGYVESNYIYLFKDKYYVVNIVGNVHLITISINEIEKDNVK